MLYQIAVQVKGGRQMSRIVLFCWTAIHEEESQSVRFRTQLVWRIRLSADNKLVGVDWQTKALGPALCRKILT